MNKKSDGTVKKIDEILRDREYEADTEDEKRELALLRVQLNTLKQYSVLDQRWRKLMGQNFTLKRLVNSIENKLKRTDKSLYARVLTYEDAALWEKYKQIGTVEQCEKAMEKQKAKRVLKKGKSKKCPCCNSILGYADLIAGYCKYCGQKIKE